MSHIVSQLTALLKLEGKGACITGCFLVISNTERYTGSRSESDRRDERRYSKPKRDTVFGEIGRGEETAPRYDFGRVHAFGVQFVVCSVV